MTPEILQELLQMLVIFLILVTAVLFMGLIAISMPRIRSSLKRSWYPCKQLFMDTEWLGILIIVGIVLIFSCHGPIIIY